MRARLAAGVVLAGLVFAIGNIIADVAAASVTGASVTGTVSACVALAVLAARAAADDASGPVSARIGGVVVAAARQI